MSIDWKKLIQIDAGWISSQLNQQFSSSDLKINIRGYTIKFSGTTMSVEGFTDALQLMVKNYVYSPEKIKKLGDKAIFNSIKFFGDKDPSTDGKYGELLLFALVEAVLQCKMVAHKIRTLSNFKDQVKGGDGIFLGKYEIRKSLFHDAYLVGESKVMVSFPTAISDCFVSIDRFHDMAKSSEFTSTEFIVAKENLLIDEEIDIDELYDRLTPSTAMFKSQVLVHPVLIMYEYKKIGAIEREAATNLEAEAALREVLIQGQSKFVDVIREKLDPYEDIKKVYLDFFLIPVRSVDEFRNSLYYKIHGVPYK
jgi:hypothetical protein